MIKHVGLVKKMRDMAISMGKVMNLGFWDLLCIFAGSRPTS
jgi:hypothetical protein